MVLEKIKKIGKKKKQPKYTVKLTPDVWQSMPKLTKKQIAELLARLKEAEEERDELKKKYNELAGKQEPEEVKVIKEVLKKKKSIKKEKEKRRLALIPFRVVDGELKPIKINFVPYGGGFISGSKGIYKYFAGWELDEGEDGIERSINFLLKMKPDSKKVVRLSPSKSLDISVFNFPFIVHKALTGIYEAPVNKEGKLIEVVENEQTRYGNTELIKEIERLKKKIAELEEVKENLMAKNYEASKKYEELLVENQKLMNDLSLANYRADMTQAISQDQTEKVKGMLRDYGAMLTSSMEAQVNEMLTRRMNWVLSEGLKEVRKTLEEAYGKTIEDEVWSKVEGRYRKMFDELRTIVPKQPAQKQAPPKEAEKK